MKSDNSKVRELRKKFGPGKLTPAQREELRLAEIEAGKKETSISGLMKALTTPPPLPEVGDSTVPKIPPSVAPKIKVEEPEELKTPLSAASPSVPGKGK